VHQVIANRILKEKFGFDDEDKEEMIEK